MKTNNFDEFIEVDEIAKKTISEIHLALANGITPGHQIAGILEAIRKNLKVRLVSTETEGVERDG